MDRVRIRKLPTGVPGLDEVLGGGLPEFSFNLVAGGPGCGKTTLAQQFMFANATDERKAIYFTVFGEPPIKMLRYQQQFEFFDLSKVNRSIRFVHLGKELVEGGLAKVLERIERELESSEARFVVVDSFRSVARVEHSLPGTSALGLERFVQLLALSLTSYEATTFLIGEYSHEDTESNPVFTVADGILWLHQTVTRNSVARNIHVMKMRGQASVPGLHTVKLASPGMRVYPRLATSQADSAALASEPTGRLSTGVAGLDRMLAGGIPAGSSTLVVGPSGSGKSTLAMQFILDGIDRGEAAVLAVFEKSPAEYLRGHARSGDLQRAIAQGQLRLFHLRPLDLSADETLEELRALVVSIGAKRVAVDSLSGFELALAPSFRDDVRESLYRLVGALKSLGVTVVLTAEVTQSTSEMRLSPQGVSFLTDGVLLQRYFEVDGRLRRAMAVVKMRGTRHDHTFREYEMGGAGLIVGEPTSAGAPAMARTQRAKTKGPAKKPATKKRR